MNKKYKKLNIKYSTGFTLVETLVSLFIFSLSITAIIVVSGKGVSDTTIAKNKIIAVALAQEGIEIVRNIRDTYSLSEANPGEGWQDFINDMAQNNACGPSGCYINDILNYTVPVTIPGVPSFLTPCSSANPAPFQSGCEFIEREALPSNISDTSVTSLGFYNYEYDETPFKRTLYIECVDPSDCVEVRVESLVEWRQGTGVASVNAVEYLFNWFTTVAPTTP